MELEGFMEKDRTAGVGSPRYACFREEGKLRVFLEAFRVGEDWLVAIGGGQEPHIGAVAIALPRPSLRDPQQISSSTSVFTLTGHKEDDLAKRAASWLAARLNRVVVVTAGIHLDRATATEIARVEQLTQELVEAFLTGQPHCAEVRDWRSEVRR